MRILVAAIGSRGDVQPALALAVALRQAGHEPLVSAPPDFEAWAAQLQLPYASSGASIEAILNQHKAEMGGNPPRMLRAIRKILLQNVPLMMQSARAAAEGAHLIVSANHFFSRSIAEERGIPYTGVMYAPTLLRSAWHPPFVARWQSAPRAVNRMLWGLANLLATRVFLDPINRERARIGLPAADSFEEHVFGGATYMLACDPVVAPSPPDWGHRDIVTTGPWFYDDPAQLDPDVDAFLDAGPPPVYVGFGSMVSEDAAAATREIIAGAGASGRRVLLSKGWAGLGTENLPGHVMAVKGPMPHAKLFPRVAAVVHHGGSGTTSAALRAGVPQVIVPHIMDQYYFAHRLRVLGIAPLPIPVQRLDARRLAVALDAAFALPPGPRLEARERLRPGDGLRRAVEVIEAVGKRGTMATRRRRASAPS